MPACQHLADESLQKAISGVPEQELELGCPFLLLGQGHMAVQAHGDDCLAVPGPPADDLEVDPLVGSWAAIARACLQSSSITPAAESASDRETRWEW